MRRLAVTSLFFILIAAFLALGVWQVKRLAWKTDLIARVDARIHAPPLPAPGPADWAKVNSDSDEYRRVTVRGHFLNDREAQVYTVSALGGGYWVMTPLQTDDKAIVFINRGFVPLDRRDPKSRADGQIAGEVAVTGLLRMPETKGWLFSQANDPAHDAWYRRDVAAIASSRGLSPVAPYFIDADAAPNPGGWPRGSLTVVHFPNSHLMYAFTWFSLVALLAGTGLWLNREDLLRLLKVRKKRL